MSEHDEQVAELEKLDLDPRVVKLFLADDSCIQAITSLAVALVNNEHLEANRLAHEVKEVLLPARRELIQELIEATS